MLTIDQRLARWAEDVEKHLPALCPGCESAISQVRYGADRDTTRVRLTGASWDFDVYRAECPSCGHVLQSEGVRDADRRLETPDA